MSSPLVCLFAKPPGRGSKTRLAAAVGAERAHGLAAAMLADTVNALRRWGRARLILATPAPGADHGVTLPRWDQGGGDLGNRMERVLARGLAQAPVVLALGADAPGLPMGHLDWLLKAATEGQAALGPAEDGGFWGLGLRRCPPGLLAGLPWSAPHTGEAVRARLMQVGMAVEVGPRWFDLDEEADLAQFRERVRPEEAPSTWSALSRWGELRDGPQERAGGGRRA